jgi:hypothetical protein
MAESFSIHQEQNAQISGERVFLFLESFYRILDTLVLAEQNLALLLTTMVRDFGM